MCGDKKRSQSPAPVRQKRPLLVDTTVAQGPDTHSHEHDYNHPETPSYIQLATLAAGRSGVHTNTKEQRLQPNKPHQTRQIRRPLAGSKVHSSAKTSLLGAPPKSLLLGAATQRPRPHRDTFLAKPRQNTQESMKAKACSKPLINSMSGRRNLVLNELRTASVEIFVHETYLLRKRFMLLTASRWASVRPTLNLVYFGSDVYSLAHLRAIKESPPPTAPTFNIELVVTANDKTPVARYCSETGLVYSTWPRCAHSAENTVLSRVQELRTEFERSKRQPAGLLGLIISFGRFLPTGMITLFDRGCINVHPSLLPRWRGPCPLFHTLVVGDRVTGVTVIRIPTEQHTFDSGPILYQHAISLEGTSEPMTVRQLTDHLSPFSIEAMFQVLLHPSTLSGVEHGSHCQQSIAAQTGLAEKRASRPTPEMGRIDWCSQSAPEIVRLWHALQDSPVNVCTEMAVLKKRGDSGVAQIRLSGTGPLVVPCLTNIAESSGSVMDESGAATAEKPIPRKIGQNFGTLAGPASCRDLIGRKSEPNSQS
ncbi:hypothetical protein T265_09573 [Opisthorchis viverrini]|uniref:Formyl transferase N-terminal domain-containing protein n=1 Tax=Opisthorchis viverrini TaxID=6198 RepID=A0A074Z587_OPIVI|nr:hypothetical protein T265_09573 [Opisthorchis viverrini]KER22286.1 hypothetical protein T265_09573 [Opisthorchis viverrini]